MGWRTSIKLHFWRRLFWTGTSRVNVLMQMDQWIWTEIGSSGQNNTQSVDYDDFEGTFTSQRKFTSQLKVAMSELAVNIFSKTESRWLNEKILDKLETTSQRFVIPATSPKKNPGLPYKYRPTALPQINGLEPMAGTWDKWSTGKRHALCQK